MTRPSLRRILYALIFAAPFLLAIAVLWVTR